MPKPRNSARITRRRKRYTKPRKTISVPASTPEPTIRARYRTNAVDTVNNLLGEHPWTKQQEILRAIQNHRLVAVRSCHASGKTYAAALATIWWLMAHDEALVITTAPSDRQVKQLLWREIKQIHYRNRHLIGGKITANRLELGNKRFAFGFSTNTAERFQGFHNENILIIVDEASGVREFIFDAIIGSMTSANAKLLLIGNPASLAGTFYDAFHKNRKQWKTIHISAFDTPNFSSPLPQNRAESSQSHETSPTLNYLRGLATPEWAEEVRLNKGENSSSYQIRVLGQFPDEADDTLIPLKNIEAAISRRFDKIDDNEPVMGLDVARFGNDQTVAIVRRGPEVIELKAFRKTDLMDTTGRALDIAQRHNVREIYIDEVGMGAGVLDRMLELKKEKRLRDITPIGVNGANKSNDTDQFPNLRTQMFDGLRQRFADADISIPNDPELISQLASITYRYNSRSQLQIETKQQIRDAGRQSPDKADALTLAFSQQHRRQNPLDMWILTREHLEKRRSGYYDL